MIKTTEEVIKGYKDVMEEFMNWETEHGYNSLFSSKDPKFYNKPEFDDKFEHAAWHSQYEPLNAIGKVLKLTPDEYVQIVEEVKERIKLKGCLIEKISKSSLATLRAVEQTIAEAEKETKRQ